MQKTENSVCRRRCSLMKYINKCLSIEKVKIENIAKKFGTPIYCYSYKQLRENINKFNHVT